MTDHREQLEEFTPYLMNRIAARYNKGVESALKDVGISVAQMRALAALAESGPCSITDLSILTVIKQSTLSRTLDTMENAGLILRTAQGSDSRYRQISLTQTGRAAYDAAWPSMQNMRDTMLASLSEDERENFNSLLLRIFYDIRHHDF
ncbi:MarR family winged helix-turn-helix transcriptional regulator [Pacificibacter marinus]|jgi:DNA-binding MarR family transcriptional regulator|uniref:Transcriptional regulator SlyA n=1 Tax=Pacificibacter marinus TaxID=658057 RepID=A0A1Y5TCZ0_9RHOB|nr:MarR family winged helix-turn-helix transcriptional regulator [Pacificibacter marinus]SEL09598.1 DNA-binding transcriptional regulator, MarR family [Pacificibacter marinus]SLN59125.1 Transcriptional regulator SlyA [Pacificibacter marinus]